MVNCTFENGNKASLRHVVIDAIILRQNSILMVKRSEKIIEGGKWGLVGGYVERDETLEQALLREVLEETGYSLKKQDFFTIIDNPKRKNEDRQNIAFVYVCEVGEKIGNPDWESTEQKWFELTNLPKEVEIAFDHLRIINLYLLNKGNKHKLISYKK